YRHHDPAAGGYRCDLVDESGQDLTACRGVRAAAAAAGATGEHADKGLHAPRFPCFPGLFDPLFQLDCRHLVFDAGPAAGLVADTPRAPRMERSCGRYGTGGDAGPHVLAVELALLATA